MKKICGILFAIVLTVGSVQAQTDTPSKDKRWNVGVAGGINYSFPRIKNPFPAHYLPRVGYQAGVDIAYRLNSRMTLHGQSLLERVSNDRIDNQWESPIFNIVTLKIPFTYRYYVLPSGKSLFVEAGVSYNRIVSSQYRENLFVVCITGPCPTWYSPEIAPLTKSAVSGLAGLGVDIALQKVTIPVTLRYERYLSNYLFPAAYETQPNKSVGFETITLMTGINL
jgi:hypothetical protein